MGAPVALAEIIKRPAPLDPHVLDRLVVTRAWALAGKKRLYGRSGVVLYHLALRSYRVIRRIPVASYLSGKAVIGIRALARRGKENDR